jgi:long-subunit acyl-CoA synthetase (AMP-forming)
VAAGSSLKQTLFSWALQSGLKIYDSGGVGASWLYNAVVFANVQALLGGRVRMMLAGSAPLSPDVQMFVQSCFNAPLRQGYGLTETCAATCVALVSDNTISQVGPPQESASILLRDWDEGNYRNADKDDPAIGLRRGEILIGGPTVCLGYFVAESQADADVVAKNKSDFVTLHGQRWFCTGDIGQFTAEGNVMIIDRKKDLVKLQQVRADAGVRIAWAGARHGARSCTDRARAAGWFGTVPGRAPPHPHTHTHPHADA